MSFCFACVLLIAFIKNIKLLIKLNDNSTFSNKNEKQQKTV